MARFIFICSAVFTLLLCQNLNAQSSCNTVVRNYRLRLPTLCSEEQPIKEPIYCSERLACPTGYFCSFQSPGFCGVGTGQCIVPPQLCTKIYRPVCGCDLKEYGNECMAQSNNVSILYDGPCSNVTKCTSDSDCTSGNSGARFCRYLNGCSSGNGVCADMPEFCTLIYSPVCGCDGKTYGNPCAANSAGVTIEHFGVCEGSQCTSDEDCFGANNSMYCQFPDGTCGANVNGTCQFAPEICTDIYDPYCGCDSQVYANRCYANRQRINIKSAGTCV